jgi:2'-5' RNA ligase
MTYNFCFLGITLPEEFQNKFQKLLTDLGKINCNLKLAEPEKLPPHITIQYLDTQSEESLSQIKEIISRDVNLTSNLQVNVSGMGYFKSDNPFVIFLEVKYPQTLASFQQKIQDNLADFIQNVAKQEFHPHMTVARIPDQKAQQSFRENQDKIEKLFNQVHWSFPITKLEILGVKPGDKERVHKTIFTIPV